MNITPMEVFQLERLDSSLMPIGTNRPSGLHQSAIIQAMAEAAREVSEPIAGEQPYVRAQIGFLWERALELAWKEYMSVARPTLPFTRARRIERGRTLLLDEVMLTPDGFDRESWCLEEYKLTWRTMKKWEEDPEQHFWRWLVQVKAYLKAYSDCEGVPVRRVRLYVFWVNGDYSRKPGRGPQPTFTELTFSDYEIEDNWRTMLRYREKAKHEQNA